MDCRANKAPLIPVKMLASKISLVILLVTVLSGKLEPIRAGKVDIEKVNAFLDNHTDSREKVPYKTLGKWFDSKQVKKVTITPAMYPRLFPFCVSHEQLMDTTLTRKTSKLAKFKEIFEIIRDYHNEQDKFYHFDEKLHSIVGNNEFIKSVKLTRINTPEPDMINLRQWLHITIQAGSSGLKGLYMQSIAGPVGLPIGEFNIDFPCADLKASSDLEETGELHYCHYRPRANLYHPKVFVGYSDNARREFHVHFQWTDITCMETPYIQFLMIAVKDFILNPIHGETYQLIFSNVFLNTEFDSLDAYPYYPSWRSNMYCNADETTIFEHAIAPGKEKVNGDHKFAPIKWNAAKDVYRIQPNEAFDACVRGSDDTDKDETRLECPPV